MSSLSGRAGALLLPLACSGAAALIVEVVWMRRLALAIGGTGLALTLTLSLYMLGLGLGGALASGRRWAQAPRGYGLLELGAACWAVAVPTVLSGFDGLADHGWPGAVALAAILLLPPALLHGATLPAAAAAVKEARETAILYASNTTGAVLGSLIGPFLLMPTLGLRGAELASAALSVTAGLLALSRPTVEQADEEVAVAAHAPPGAMLAVAVSGGAALALEVAWSRLGALLLGGSVYAMSLVLAVFLVGVAAGAALGARLGQRAMRGGLIALGLGAAAGAWTWGALPHGLALAYDLAGESWVYPAGALLLALAMGAAPVASGLVFAAALGEGAQQRSAGHLLTANAVGSALGAVLAGLVGLPHLGVLGLALAVSGLCAVAALLLPSPAPRRRLLPALIATVALIAFAPSWDRQLYAVGMTQKLDLFADLSPRAVERFARDGWRLLAYTDGVNGTVAVGESTRSGVRWLSVNGKVDASTGDDMPTQVLSGRLPVLIAAAANNEPIDAVVVGLASGVTAGETLDAGARSVIAIEIEPAVVHAAAYFSAANHDVLDDPRAIVVVADARAWLSRPGPRFPVIISEPSNPWLTGVSNLFTQQYWELARRRMKPDGVFCQWVQLYALPSHAMRGLIRTFITVFPNTWLFETIPGADALLIAAPSLPEDLPIQPLLGPRQLAALAGVAPLNTDDQPWIEFEAPWWLYRSTGAANRQMLLDAAELSPR